MKLRLLLITILLAASTFEQDKPKRIGTIDFFGYAGFDLNKLRDTLPIHEGDELELETGEEKVQQVRAAVQRVTGHQPTDISVGCCDRQGNWNIQIGLSGKPLQYNPQPQGTTQLPESALHLYERFLDLLLEAVQKGAGDEDQSQGYALSEYPPLKVIQLEMRSYAVKRAPLLRQVLATSSQEQQRTAAAHLLGYAPQSKAQLAALAKASRDVNSTVRNNATRALFVLAKSSSQTAAAIPAEGFAEMLLSGTWTDLNKASNLLAAITRSRKAEVLAPLRKSEVLARLIEIARWRTGHAEAAKYILGRLAGIPEKLLERLVLDGKVEEIIKPFQSR